MLSSLSPYTKLWCALLTLVFVITLSAPTWAQEEGGEPAEAPTEEVTPAEPEEEAPAEEEEAARTVADLEGDMDALWTLLAACLVFFMQAGFALVEAGFTRAKSACNIIMKNLMDLSVGSIAFWLVGFGLMFGTTNGLFGTTDFVFDAGDDAFGWAFLIFQTVFCATAATIVSGAVAERTKFTAYLAYSILITLIVYPIFGSWAWGSLWNGDGFLEGMGFYDFAGSTVVHSIGGWCALAGAIVIGPRIGKYSKDGKVKPIPGHNIPIAALGVFILWLGWFGFNAGSTTAVGGGGFAYIAVTTNIAAAAGAIGAMIVSWVMFKKPDVSFALNGALAGLVSITAGCDAMSVPFAAISGLIGGCLVVFSCVFFDKIKIDDPVGAVSVHGVCGAWGTIAVGLFMTDGGLLTGGGIGQLITQLIGVGVGFGWAFFTSLIIFSIIKATIGLRVSAEEEMKGLDICEHGMYAYPPHLVLEGAAGGSMAATVSSGEPAAAVSPQGS